MKLIYKGNYKSEDQLPKGILPENAVKFEEPDTPESIIKAATVYMLPVFVLVAAVMAGSYLMHGTLNVRPEGGFGFFADLIIALLLVLLTLFPHEMLHAVCFGRDAEVELYVSFKNAMMFVVSTQPVKKGRFIFLSLLPNLVFGWLPLLVWAVLPYSRYSNILFLFSMLSTTLGLGDYLNVANAIRQMPKGSMQQLSGMNSYWFKDHH